MTSADHSYYGLMASTWDVGRDTQVRWADSIFYLRIVQQYGQPVLDVGCATGRIVLDYLAQGIDIDGVDSSLEMLARCRGKAAALGLAPDLYQQRMETLDLPRTYGTILIPSSSFQLLTDPAQARAAMGHCFAQLQTGGALVMSIAFDWHAGEPIDTGWKLAFEKVRPEDGARVRSWAHTWVEPDQHLMHTEQRYEVELNGTVIAREEHRQSPETRWYSQAQMVELFSAAGFVDIQLFRGFTGEAATPEDRLFCALGVKP